MPDQLTLSKFRHSCLLVDVGGVRLLLDPGVFSAGFESLTDLSAVLITHQHADHLDVDRLKALLAANPQARLIADSASTAQLADAGVSADAASSGDEFDVAGVSVTVYGGAHAQIAPGVPVPPNVGYAIGGRYAYAGDAYDMPPEPTQVVGIPTAAPWLRAADTVGFLQQVQAQAVVPVHEALLATTDVFYGIYQRFAQENDHAFTVIDDGQPKTF